MPPPAGGLRVVEFKDDALYQVLSGDRFGVDDARGHRQAQYLRGYLQEIGAKRIVIEEEYVDADYLADFASFYVSCFEPYQRLCKRLHFFSSEFDEAQLEDHVVRKTPSRAFRKFRKSYLGFIVVRPLPAAVIGRTALKPYASDGGRRRYTALSNYKVTLHGIHLSVRSLAFQQQDTAVAACATVAIWSALHRTSELWGTRSMRPHAITTEAARHFGTKRALPNSGLLIEQMLAAFHAAGLESEAYIPEESWGAVPLSSLIYAYSHDGIPVILIGRLGEGSHAVTIAGYSLNPTRVVARERADKLFVLDERGNVARDLFRKKVTRSSFWGPPIPLVGLRINEFYAHDDGAGPFSRLVLKPPAETPYHPGDHARFTHFETQLRFRNGQEGYQVMRPISVVVPVYPKIRLRFEEVLIGWIPRVHGIFGFGAGVETQELDSRTEWDVFLTDTNHYKSDVRRLPLHPARQKGLLRSSQPRFIWRAIMRVDGVEKVEMLIDATSFKKAFQVFAINWFDDAVALGVKTFIEGQGDRFHRLLGAPLERFVLTEIEQRASEVIGVRDITGGPGGTSMDLESGEVPWSVRAEAL